MMLATAESCTGGGVAQCGDRNCGSSAWFDRGFVTYSNQAKIEMLGVSPDTLARHGAVSEATVREMVEGALQHSQAQVALAVSGIAGPDGGTPEKPVGTVWFAWGTKGTVQARKYQLPGDRDSVRESRWASRCKAYSNCCMAAQKQPKPQRERTFCTSPDCCAIIRPINF